MNANLLVLALVLAVMPLPVLAGVLLLTAEHGREQDAVPEARHRDELGDTLQQPDDDRLGIGQ